MKFVWKRINNAEFKRLSESHKFTPLELKIINLRRKEKPLTFISDNLNYSERHIRRLSEIIIEKIFKEL